MILPNYPVVLLRPNMFTSSTFTRSSTTSLLSSKCASLHNHLTSKSHATFTFIFAKRLDRSYGQMDGSLVGVHASLCETPFCGGLDGTFLLSSSPILSYAILSIVLTAGKKIDMVKRWPYTLVENQTWIWLPTGGFVCRDERYALPLVPIESTYSTTKKDQVMM